MNINEFLMPFIAVNEDGYRKIRPNQGRVLPSNALHIKKHRNVSYREMSTERVVMASTISVLEELHEGQQRRDM